MTMNLSVSEGVERLSEMSLSPTPNGHSMRGGERAPGPSDRITDERTLRACMSMPRAARLGGQLTSGLTEDTARFKDVLDAMPPTLRFKFEVAMAAKKIEGLSARETTVLKMIRQGCSSKMIAAEFAMDISGVERHRASLMRKLNAEHVADAVRIAIYAGLGD